MRKKFRPASAAMKKKHSHQIKYGLTPEEMFKLDTHQLEIGIQGYQIHKKYFDHRQTIWHKKRAEILSSHKHIWPPEDWPRSKEDDRKVMPKKRTYLDDLYKWCYSYYNKEKAEELLSQGKIDTKEYEKKIKFDTERRKKFKENEEAHIERRKGIPDIPEYKQDAYEKAAENKKDYEEHKKDPLKKVLERYKNKPQTSRCDRVSTISEAQFLGEQVPFYDTYVPEGEELDKKKLFWPSKTRTSAWRRAPMWKYPKEIGPNMEYKEKVDEKLKDKVDNYMDAKNLKKEDLWINIVDSYHKVTHHGENKMKIYEDFKYKDEEQYQNYLERQPKKYIGPQQYWKMPKETFTKRGKKSLSIASEEGVYYMDRKKTDRRVHTAGTRKAVY